MRSLARTLGPAMLLILLVAPVGRMLGGGATAARADVPELPPVRSAGMLFQRRCAKCHGSDGRGDDERDGLPELPDFTSAAWQQRRTTAHLIAAILDGRGKRMPAFSGRLTQEQARSLANYIRTLAPTPGAGTEQPVADDFQAQFRALQDEFQSLRKQFDDLKPAPQ